MVKKINTVTIMQKSFLKKGMHPIGPDVQFDRNHESYPNRIFSNSN